jgi:hypothetical protein
MSKILFLSIYCLFTFVEKTLLFFPLSHIVFFFIFIQKPFNVSPVFVFVIALIKDIISDGYLGINCMVDMGFFYILTHYHGVISRSLFKQWILFGIYCFIPFLAQPMSSSIIYPLWCVIFIYPVAFECISFCFKKIEF